MMISLSHIVFVVYISIVNRGNDFVKLTIVLKILALFIDLIGTVRFIYLRLINDQLRIENCEREN